MKEWTKVVFADNQTLDIDDGHYISFLRKEDFSFQNTIFGMTEDMETALVRRFPWKCLILAGDFRKEYEEVIDGGYEACLAVYEKHKATHRSYWSEDN